MPLLNLLVPGVGMGGGSAIAPTVPPTLFLTGDAQTNIVVSGAAQRNVAATGNAQRSVGLSGDAEVNA
jgi:hypothetical protein